MKPMIDLARLFCAGMLLASAVRVAAQSYAVDSWTVDGGGGTSTGAVYGVSGTITASGSHLDI